MTLHRRAAAALALFLLGLAGCPFLIDGAGSGGSGFVPSADAQFIRNLIARLRGETLPDGIVKSNGRLEATQVDVSSKYPGRLAEVTVEEGSSVTQGQVIAKITSPEYEAQLRAAKADVQKANDALAAAEAEITSRAERARIRQVRFRARTGTDEDRLHHQAGLRATEAQLRLRGCGGAELHVAARSGPVPDRELGGARSIASSRSSMI